MNFAVIGQHRDFFRKQQWIECEGMLSPAELGKVNAGVANALAHKLNMPAAAVLQTPAAQLLAAGRDLWRSNHSLKKILLHKNLASVGAALIEQQPLRYGYDQLFPASPQTFDVGQPLTLEEMSCIQGVLCGAMLCVQQPQDEPATEPSALFSLTPGNAVYFSPAFPIPFQDLVHRAGYIYLMIVYVKESAVYQSQDKDPHVHDLKRLGYYFGDRLSNHLNPLVYIR